MYAIYVEERRLVEQLGHEEFAKRMEQRNFPLYIDIDVQTWLCNCKGGEARTKGTEAAVNRET